MSTQHLRKAVSVPQQPAIIHGLAVLIALAIAFPYAIGLPYFRHGSRLLDSALAEMGRERLEVHVISGESTLNSPYLAQAISLLESATRWIPYHAHSYAELAQAYLLNGNYAGARAALQTLSRFPARSTPEFAERMTLYAQLRDIANDDERLKRDLKSFGIEAMDFVQAGRYYEEQRKNELALPLYEVAFLLDRSWSDIWYAQGRALEGASRIDEALQAYQQAFELARYQRIRPSDVLLRIGIAYCSKTPPDLESALRSLDAALALDDFEARRSKKPQAHYQRAEVLRAMGRDPSEYIQAYQDAIRAYQEHFQAHLRLGIAYLEDLRDLAKAEKELHTALHINPNAAIAYFYLGEVYTAQGERDKAVTMYEKAAALEPDNAQVQERLRALRGSDQE